MPMPFLVKSNASLEDVKRFVVVDVKMQRRAAARWRDLGPHRVAASGFFTAEMNHRFLAESAQDFSIT